MINVNIYELVKRDVLENDIMKMISENNRDLQRLESLLNYLIEELLQSQANEKYIQAQNNYQLPFNTQENEMWNQGHNVEHQEEFKYPDYVFENSKNIKHIKIAYFANEDIFKKTNVNLVQYFQKNKKSLTN